MKVMKVSALLRGPVCVRTPGGGGRFNVFVCVVDMTSLDVILRGYKLFSKRILPNWPNVEFDEI